MSAIPYFIATVLVFLSTNQVAAQADNFTIMGGGMTILVGGDGGMMQDSSKPTPVITYLSFQASREDDAVTGRFECLALGPGDPVSFAPGSGEFSKNIMYVTGNVTGMTVSGKRITILGRSTITGVGAGMNLEYRFEVQEGGPGSFFVLTTENPEGGQPLVFKEQLIEGQTRIIR